MPPFWGPVFPWPPGAHAAEATSAAAATPAVSKLPLVIDPPWLDSSTSMSGPKYGSSTPLVDEGGLADRKNARVRVERAFDAEGGGREIVAVSHRQAVD